MKTLTKKLISLIAFIFSLTLFSQTGWGQTLIISEVADPGDTYQARFVEIYNATGSSIDLSAGTWYLSRQSNGSTWADIALTGTISSGGTYIIAYSSTDFNTAYGFNPDQSSGYISGNGDDGYFLYSGGDHASGTLFDAYGVIDEDGTGKTWEYTDSHAVRNSSVCSANTTWTASEWTISSANVADMTPGSHTISCSSNDNDSQVSASSTLSEPATISSLQTSANGVQVFDFTFTDLGTSDGLATIIDQLQITQGSANGVADWTNAIAGAVLKGPDITNMVGTVNATDITFSGSGFISISDNSNETYTLSIWLNTDLSAISDNDILEFAMNYSNITADASGSLFGSGAPESGDTDVAIDIDATELRFAQQPTTANINDCMSPDVAVEAADINGNRDLDFTESIRITSTGSLTGTPVDVTAVSGLATFSGANCIEHSATGTNLTLNAERTTTLDWDVVSDSFDITDINACGLEEFNDGTTAPPGWTFTNIGGTYTTATNYGTSSPSLKMDATGDIIETATVTSPSQLTFWIKGQGTDASSALLVEGWDGSWNTIENITNLPTTGTTKTYNTGLSSYTKFRFSYTKSAGNLAFDDVDVTCGSCAEPTNDATALNFPSKNSTSIDLSWTNGNGGNRIVICREGAAVSFTPADNNTYTANSDYSAGTEVGTAGEGNKVIYNGNASTTTVTGLIPGTTYYFKIYEYGCSGGAEDYLTSGTPAEGNETTLPENVSNFSLTCITNTTATLTWTIPTGGFDGILVAVRESTLTPSNPSCDGVWLTSPSTVFSAATTYCDNTTDSRYVYNSTGSTVTITGLTPGADYVFKAFTYNESDWTNGTQTAAIAEVKNVTGENTTPANQQISVMWNNPVTCYDEILVIAHKGGSITAGAGPANGNDGSGYVADASEPFSGTDLGTDDFVVYKGTQTNFDATDLENGTQYCFKIFVRRGTEWSSGVELCQTPADVTVFNPGELIIIGFDSNVGGGRDSLFLTSLVDIKPGTEFLYVNSRYEAGAPANVRTAEWHGGGDDPDADPGIFKISYSSTAASSIPAGSIISFSTNGYKADYIKVNGTLNADFSSSNIVGSANIHATDGDQIWLLQGNFTDQGTYYTLDGNVLWGLTNNIDWVPIDQPVSDASDGTGRESRLNPDLECFNLSMPTGKGYALYLNSSDHNNSKRNLLLAIMNGGNWNDGVGDATMNFNADFTSPYEADSIGKPFTVIVGGSTDGTWLGGASAYVNDWFSCMNWEGLTVPDSTVDVTIPNTTDKPIIDHTSGKAAKYSYIAECNNITIDNNFLTIEGSVFDTLFVHGDLTVQNSGTLDMNSGNSNDGLIYISGNWDNQATFDAGKGTIVFNGENSQTLTTSAANETFNNLRINNSNLLGVTTNNNLIINDTLSQENSLLNLNGNNIELKGVYENTNSYFEGDINSDFTISSDTDNGNIDSIYFKNDFYINNFSVDRTGNQVVLMTNLSVQNNLTVTNGSVVLTSGHNYDVNGTLINTPGTPDALIIKSDAGGTASLIQNAGAVPATVERYLSGNNWHYIFAPLTQIDTSVFTVAPWGDINPNVYFYDESVADFWAGTTIYNPTGWTGINGITSDYLQTDRGYLNYFTADKVYSQSGGNLTDADKNFTLSYTDNGTGNEPNTGTDWDNFEGWNLLGNPYVSAIDWDYAGFDKTYIENFIYYYDDIQEKYLCYGGNPPWDNNGVSINGGTQYIPAGQGFFVKALSTGNGQILSIPKTARIHNAQTFYKKREKNDNSNLLKLQIRKDSYTDETIIRTLPSETGVTDVHDANYDAYKMFSWDKTKPQLYSVSINHNFFFAVNSLPEITGNKEVPLGVYVGEAGNYSIQLKENYFKNMHIWLEDRDLSINANLLKKSTYSFSQTAETNDNRFFLHFEINHAPTLNTNIPDQNIPVNKMYEYNLPENLFNDQDFEDNVSISVSLEDGNNLPLWLSYDTELNKFFGIPGDVQELNIKVTGTDIFNKSVSDVFILNVASASEISLINKNSVSVYPNPSKGKFTVQLSNSNKLTKISISDITGKVIINTLNTGYKTEFDLSNFPKSIYFVNITGDKQIIRKKLVLE